MSIFMILNIGLVIFILVYGISLGIGNSINRAIVTFKKDMKINQSNTGRILDALWYISIIYFITIGQPILIKIYEISKNLIQYT